MILKDGKKLKSIIKDNTNHKYNFDNGEKH